MLGGKTLEPIIRKTEINLITLGSGVILFGLWTLVKFLLTILFADKNDNDYAAFFSLSAWVLTLIEFSLRCYIGFSARSEGQGKRKGVLYLVITSIIIFFYFAIIALEIAILFISPEYIFYVIIALIIDSTSTIFLIELMINSVRLRRLRKQTVEHSEHPNNSVLS